MKTTKELIIADITAKVEAKLASQKVNLSLVDDLIKKFELMLKKAQKQILLVKFARRELLLIKAKIILKVY
jgi:hypothetical protein